MAKRKSDARTTLRLPDDVREGMMQMAEAEGRSFNRHVVTIFRRLLQVWREAAGSDGAAVSGILPPVPPAAIEKAARRVKKAAKE